MNFLKASEWGKHKKKSIIWSRHYSNDPFPAEVRNSTGNSFSWKLQRLCSFRLRGIMIEAIVLVESKLSCCAYHKIHSGRGMSWHTTLFFLLSAMYLCTAQPSPLCIFQSAKKSYQLYSACSKCRFQRFMTQSNQNQFAPEHSKALLLTEGHFYAKFQLSAWFFFSFLFFWEKLQKILVMVEVVFFTSFICQIMELH